MPRPANSFSPGIPSCLRLTPVAMMIEIDLQLFAAAQAELVLLSSHVLDLNVGPEIEIGVVDAFGKCSRNSVPLLREGRDSFQSVVNRMKLSAVASLCSSTSVSRPSSSHQSAAESPAGPAPMIKTSCMKGNRLYTDAELNASCLILADVELRCWKIFATSSGVSLEAASFPSLPRNLIAEVISLLSSFQTPLRSRSS